MSDDLLRQQLHVEMGQLLFHLPTRRERIATAALQGLLARGQTPEMKKPTPWTREQIDAWPFSWYARTAVRYADALMAELDKPEAAGGSR